MKTTFERKLKRHARIRAKIAGTSTRPRFAVFRSNAHIYGMLIDDEQGKTLMSVSDLSVADKKLTKVEKAKEVGQAIATKAKEGKITKVVFDRGGYLYHGRVRALAEGARSGGLEF